jgi:hypothetical protein
MSKKEIISNLLLNKVGSILLPKEEGEVEIPTNKKEIWVTVGNGEVLISNDTSGIKFEIENDCLVLPNILLRQAKLNDRELIMIESDGNILLRASNIHLKKFTKEFSNMLDEKQTNVLLDILIGNVPDIMVEDQFQKEPTLFLLENKDFTFRPIGFPFKFFGNFENGEMVLNNSSTFYFLLPGLNKKNNESGFLLLTEALFSKILYVLKLNSIVAKEQINRDLIFHYTQFADGLFKIFISPLEDICEEDVNKTKEICGNPQKFVETIFRRDDSTKGTFVSTITKSTLKKFNNKPNIG